MLNNDSHENGKKWLIGPLGKKKLFHLQHTLRKISLPLFCTAKLQRETS